MVNADINASVDCIVPFTGTGIKAQNDRIVNRYYHIVPFAGTGIKAQNDRIVNRYYHIVPFAGTGIKAIKG